MWYPLLSLISFESLSLACTIVLSKAGFEGSLPYFMEGRPWLEVLSAAIWWTGYYTLREERTVSFSKGIYRDLELYLLDHSKL